jgi:hypothetical protein
MFVSKRNVIHHALQIFQVRIKKSFNLPKPHFAFFLGTDKKGQKKL